MVAKFALVLRQFLFVALLGGTANGGWSPAEHWAFQPLAPSAPHAICKGETQIDDAHPIDLFLERRHDELGLTAADGLAGSALLRRATFDLIGLAPTPQEIDAFVGQWRIDPEMAYQRLLDRLLASPGYGERWGRHWLDLVRYADTAGDAADYPVPEAYKYRNYVIASFNADKPYPQFVREQIAGDLLAARDEEHRWEQTVATGYVAISRRIGVSPHHLEHLRIEDTIDNLGKTFLGLTIGCARCHDHKFDPISMEDYYGLYGFFESSVYPHAGAEHKPWRQDFVYRIGKEQADRRLAPLRRELEEWNRRERAQMEVYRSFQRMKVTDASLTRESAWARLLEVRAERAEVARRFPDLEIAYALQDGTGVDSHIQRGGSPIQGDRGSRVRRGFLRALGGAKLPEDVRGSGRVHLANWIVAQPLAARVMVNRIWLQHFGQALVDTPSDFGVRGSPPTHPELVDYLAAAFMERNGSVKSMHRTIMTSRAYRRSSEDIAANVAIDPENRFYWRGNRRRLDAEQLRDSVMQAAGTLDRSPGGRHPMPHRLTYFYRQHDPFQEDYLSHRRSVYLMQRRLQKNPFLELFDGPDGNSPLARRDESTTGPQALYFMNSPFIHHQSRALARRLLRVAPDTAGRVRWAYRACFCRPPLPEEIRRAEAYLDRVRRDFHQSEDAAWAGYLRGMIGSNEFLFID